MSTESVQTSRQACAVHNMVLMRSRARAVTHGDLRASRSSHSAHARSSAPSVREPVARHGSSMRMGSRRCHTRLSSACVSGLARPLAGLRGTHSQLLHTQAVHRRLSKKMSTTHSSATPREQQPASRGRAAVVSSAPRLRYRPRTAAPQRRASSS